MKSEDFSSIPPKISPCRAGLQNSYFINSSAIRTLSYLNYQNSQVFFSFRLWQSASEERLPYADDARNGHTAYEQPVQNLNRNLHCYASCAETMRFASRDSVEREHPVALTMLFQL